LPRKKKKEECKTIPAWLISFGDLMSLVLTFFILLFSMGTISLEKFQMVIKGFTEYLGGRKVFLQEQLLKENKAPVEFENMYPKVENKRKILQKKLEVLKQVLLKAGINAEVYAHGSEVRFRVNTDKMFPPGSYVPLKTALPYITEICKALSPLGLPLIVEGYTDNTGSYFFNMDLSLKRALYIMKFFQSCGYPSDLLSVRGYGPSKPIADNNTPEGRAKNRRVEFVIQTKDY
jgi:chemotaxis protein MotB